MNLYEIIKYPFLTEKVNLIKELNNQVVFKVALNSNKIEIKKAVEKIFNVTVLKVSVINVRKKNKRMGKFEGQTSAWKKAIITLKENDKIGYFEGA